jgi:Secretion system C-terminal sorting domain
MKKILIILFVNLLFSHFLFSQGNNRINTFFNDTLKGKWILQTNCIYEAQHCDTIGKGTEYLIFSSISSQNFVKFSTNGYWNNEYGDSTELYLPMKVVIGISWTVDDFLSNIYPRTKLCIQNQDHDNLTLLINNLMGVAKSYIRDKSYTNIYNVISDLVTIYPNPVKSSFILEGEIPESAQKVLVDIVSTDGRLLLSKVLSERGNIKKQIDMPAVHAGMYFVLLHYDGQIKACLKICKE